MEPSPDSLRFHPFLQLRRAADEASSGLPTDDRLAETLGLVAVPLISTPADEVDHRAVLGA